MTVREPSFNKKMFPSHKLGLTMPNLPNLHKTRWPPPKTRNQAFVNILTSRWNIDMILISNWGFWVMRNLIQLYQWNLNENNFANIQNGRHFGIICHFLYIHVHYFDIFEASMIKGSAVFCLKVT